MNRLVAILALLLALAGYGLYQQIQRNGKLGEAIKQREQQLLEQTRAVDALQLEIIERDEAVQLLEAKLNEHNQRTESVRTVVRKVYVQPDAEPWAKTEPPPAVAAAVAAGIDCLWQHDGNQNCGDLTTGGNDG